MARVLSVAILQEPCYDKNTLKFLRVFLERGARMISQHLSGTELVKKNGHLVYASTKRDGSRLEVYLIQGKATNLVYLHAFMLDKHHFEHYTHGSSLEAILADPAFKEYTGALTDVWNSRINILSGQS